MRRHDHDIDIPDFTSPKFLERHIQSTLAFYEPRVLAPDGGFRGCFLDDGTSFDPEARYLVGSARYVLNYATAYRFHGDPVHLSWAQYGLNFLNTAHKQENGHYAWLLENGVVTDSRVMAYGHAFVLLAAASCLRAGTPSALSTVNDIFDFMETYFWDEAGGAYADERDASLKTLSPYRGQNANMHMCEALLEAWQATGDVKFLDRAEQLANRFAFDLAAQSGGKIWEHYDTDWNVDMEFNIDFPNDRYKPWGFQPGHQTEWAKLLLILDSQRPNKKWLPKAKSLFDAALETGWDKEHGGIVYGVAPDGSFCASEKYFWVQSESFAAAWRLYRATGDDKYLADYNRIWQWSWEHMIDHTHGAWFRGRHRDGSPMDNKKSPNGKTDYHTMGACWDVLSVNDDYDEKSPYQSYGYDREAVGTGIVHFGIGNFHRAHQAVYAEDLLERGDTRWGITGVSLRSASMRDLLAPQDYLYTLAILGRPLATASSARLKTCSSPRKSRKP